MSLSPQLLHLLPKSEIEPHLDLEHLQQMSEGCREFEQELLELFLEDSRHHLQVLQQAIAASNSPQIYQTAHHLKGSGANVGASKVQAIAAMIEKHYAPAAVFPAEFSPAPLLTDLLLTDLEESLNQIQGWLRSRQP
jgi:HPt (histidine-containing phosphotransfer) domain-containing protein